MSANSEEEFGKAKKTRSSNPTLHVSGNKTSVGYSLPKL
jgi:hypothetical protein